MVQQVQKDEHRIGDEKQDEQFIGGATWIDVEEVQRPRPHGSVRGGVGDVGHVLEGSVRVGPRRTSTLESAAVTVGDTDQVIPIAERDRFHTVRRLTAPGRSSRSGAPIPPRVAPERQP